MAKKIAIFLVSLMLLFTSCSLTNQVSVDFHFEEVKSFTETINCLGNGNFTSEINNILIDKTNPKGIYVLTGSGMFKSDDGCLNWKMLTLPELFPTNASIDNYGNIYLVYFDSIWASYDRGIHWEKILSIKGLGAFDGYKFIVTFGNKLCVAAGSKILESSDKGLHFKEININIDLFRMTGQTIEKIYIDPTNPDIIFVLDNQRLIFSSNDGSSFQLLNITSNSQAYDEVWDIEALKDGVIVTLATPSTPQFNSRFDLLLSKDCGKTWKVMQENVPFSSGLIKDPNNDKNLFAFGTGLFELCDCGSSYQYLGLSKPSAIAFDCNDASHIYVGTSCSKLFEKKAGSGNLRIIDKDDYPVTSIAVSDSCIYVAKNGIYKSQDQIYWEKLAEKGDFVIMGNTHHNSILIGSRDGGVFTYDEASKKLTKLSDEKVLSMITDNNKLNAYIGTEHGVYKYSFEKGTLEHLAFSTEISVVAVDYANSNVIYAAFGTFDNGHAIYRSVNGGKSWNLCDDNILDIKDKTDLQNLSGLDWPMVILANGKDIYVSIFPSFPGQQNMFIGYGRLKGGLFVSSNYGKTWHYVETILEGRSEPLIYVSNILEYNGKIFIALGNPFENTCNTIEYSKDLNAWREILTESSLEYIASTYIDRDTGILYIGTFGGIYEEEIDILSTQN
jgi:hypothetical protein